MITKRSLYIVQSTRTLDRLCLAIESLRGSLICMRVMYCFGEHIGRFLSYAQKLWPRIVHVRCTNLSLKWSHDSENHVGRILELKFDLQWNSFQFWVLSKCLKKVIKNKPLVLFYSLSDISLDINQSTSSTSLPSQPNRPVHYWE